VGFSRRKVAHLGGLSAVGLNCASCHVGEVRPAGGGASVRVLGMTGQFDAEAFFGAVIVATFKTADPANLKRFVSEYLRASAPAASPADQTRLHRQWQSQQQAITQALAAEAATAKELPAGTLQPIAEGALRLDHETLAKGAPDLAAFSRSVLRLFHNMRA